MDTSSRRNFMKSSGLTTGAGLLAAALIGENAAAQEVELNTMSPTPAQIQAFLALPEGPVVMVNLLKYKDGGREEYLEYGLKVEPILKSLGAEIIFNADCKSTLIGGAQWDSVVLVRYPDRMTLIQMSQSPEYQAIHHHRENGLDGQVNLAVFEQKRSA